MPRPEILKVGHACDGSALIQVGDGHFLNATDEDNVIRLYRLEAPAEPVREFPLDDFLKPEVRKNGKPKECDLEAGARVGDRIYWISSHGNDKSGNQEPSRHRLFATAVKGVGAKTRLEPLGHFYSGLIKAAIATGTPVGAALKAARKLAHRDGGIDIEGLEATRSGSLLIGFRSPLVNDRAIVIQLTNPDEVLLQGSEPQFGPDVLLDLGGQAIRDIASAGEPDHFWILSGEPGSGPKSGLYYWIRGSAPRKVRVRLPEGGGPPEGLLLEPNGDLYVALDGGEQGTPKGKDLPTNERSFLLQKLNLPPGPR